MAPWPFSNSPSSPEPPKKPDDDTTHYIPVRPYSSSKQTPRPFSDDNDDENNPFIAFRRFADDQFRILASGLSAVPTILSDLQARGADSRWSDSSFSSRAEQPLAFMSQHFEPPMPSSPSACPALAPPQQPPPTSEAIAAARALLVQSRNANAAAGVRPDAILRLFRDHETLPPLGWEFDSVLGHGNDEPVWLSTDWFARSPYSPARLETHRHCHQQGSMWRAAFEDLMSASLGKEGEARDAWTGRREDQGLYAAWAQTPRDWMLGLQCRGVLPPMLPGLYRLERKDLIDEVFKRTLNEREDRIPPLGDFWDLVREVGTFDADERMVARETPQTELDAYERFLGRANEDKREHKIERREQGEKREITEETVSQSKILSTLSTTERTTLPDGTVTTKIVLKKRFADGREESTETVSTSHGQAGEQRGSSDQAQSRSSHSGQDQTNEKKKGWFWF